MSSVTTALVTVSQAQLPALPADATLKKLNEVSAETRRAVVVERTGIDAARSKFQKFSAKLSSEGTAGFVVIGGVASAIASGVALAYFGFPLLADFAAGVVAAGLPFGSVVGLEGLNGMRADRKINAGNQRIAALEAKATEARAAVLSQTSESTTGLAELEQALRDVTDNDGTIEKVAGALAKLPEAEQKIIAPVVMSQVFTPEGAPSHGDVSVPDAAAFYAELERLGAQGLDPYVPAPAKPLDAPSERRFAQQMIAFEALLATSLCKRRDTFNDVLAELVAYSSRDKLPEIQKARGAALVFAMADVSKSVKTVGAMREPIAKAAAIAAADWTTPLERAGYIALAERFFDIIAAYGIHTGGYEKRLRDALENSDGSSSNTEEAKRLLGDRA